MIRSNRLIGSHTQRIEDLRLLRGRGYDVVIAASIKSALTAAAGNEIDLALCDIGLPDGNGYNLMKELQTLYHVKGIALTGYGSDTDISRSHDAGFVTHLTKPVHVQALESALEVIQTLLLR